jgi:integral membrane protein
VTKLFPTYRVLAYIVGILLAFCSLVAFPAKYFATEGSSLQDFGESASIMWLFHGWVFIIYVVVAFLLARHFGWSPAFTILTLVAGLIPLLIFFVERKVTARVRAEVDDPAGDGRVSARP